MIHPRSPNASRRPDFHIAVNVGGHYDSERPDKHGPKVPTMEHLTGEKCWIAPGYVTNISGLFWFMPNRSSFPDADEKNGYAPWMWNHHTGSRRKGWFYGQGHPDNTANIVFGDGHVQPVREAWVLQLKQSGTRGDDDDPWDRWYGNASQ